MSGPDAGSGVGAAASVFLLGAPGPRPVGGLVAPRVEVRNTGTVPMLMLGVLDGSETGTRYPLYLPSVSLLEVGGYRVVAAPPPPEDPLVGPLRAADFVAVGPAGAFDPTSGAGRLPLSTFANFRPEVPGTYRFTLVLDTSDRELSRWLGRFGQTGDQAELAALLSRVPSTRIEATHEVEVV